MTDEFENPWNAPVAEEPTPEPEKEPEKEPEEPEKEPSGALAPARRGADSAQDYNDPFADFPEDGEEEEEEAPEGVVASEEYFKKQGLGKFKDLDSFVKSYKEMEREYGRVVQEQGELRKAQEEAIPPEVEELFSTPLAEMPLSEDWQLLAERKYGDAEVLSGMTPKELAEFKLEAKQQFHSYQEVQKRERAQQRYAEESETRFFQKNPDLLVWKPMLESVVDEVAPQILGENNPLSEEEIHTIIAAKAREKLSRYGVNLTGQAPKPQRTPPPTLPTGGYPAPARQKSDYDESVW